MNPLKTIVVSVALAFVSATSPLSALWKQYETVRNADKPRECVTLLEQIIEEASAQRLAWDFYDACNKRYDAVVSRNWKLRPQADSARTAAFDAFDEPIIDILRGRMKIADVLAAKDTLQSLHNPDFYSKVGYGHISGMPSFAEALPQYLRNDYDFALWYLSGHNSDRDTLLAAMDSAFASSYPLDAFVDFVRTSDNSDREKSIARKQELYDDYVSRWPDKAVALMAQERILQCDMDSLSRHGKATSLQYRDLRKRCAEFEKRRASVSGFEKHISRCCKGIEAQIKTLDGKKVFARVDSSSVKLFFRNLGSAKMSVRKQEEDGVSGPKSTLISRKNVINTVRSYFTLDSAVVQLPQLDDGTYSLEVKSGKLSFTEDFERYSVSVALVREDGQWKIYAADASSGKALAECDLCLQDAQGNILAGWKAFSQTEVFTVLPETFQSILSNRKEYSVIRVSYIDKGGILRSSLKCPVTGRRANPADIPAKDRMRAEIFTDCGAYHKGDILHCKAVLYTEKDAEGHGGPGLNCVPEGVESTMKLVDSENNTLCSRVLSTNDYGSVSCDFTLPSECRGGWFRIEIHSGKTFLAQRGFQVDDFILPDFDCEFYPTEELYFPGDSLSLKGRVINYSGNASVIASARWEFQGKSHTLNISPDGGFVIDLLLPEKDSPDFWDTVVTVYLTAWSGQTREFTRYVSLQSALSLSARLINAVEATVRPLKLDVLRERKAYFKTEVKNAVGAVQNMEVLCILKRGDDTLRMSSARSPLVHEEPLDEFGPGEFTFVVKLCTNDKNGGYHKLEMCKRFIYLPENATYVNADVESLFIPEDDSPAAGSVSFAMGASQGPVWAVLSIYGDNERLLHTSPLYLSGVRGAEGSTAEIAVPWGAEWPDAVAARVFYFKNGQERQWNHEFRKPSEEKELLVEWKRFDDRTLPGTSYSIAFRSNLPAETLAAIYDKSLDEIYPSVWNEITMPTRFVACPAVSSVCGVISEGMPHQLALNCMMTKSVQTDYAKKAAMAVQAGAIAENIFDSGNVSSDDEIPAIREDFASTLYWQPFLRAGEDGLTRIDFSTSDKTGTFNVKLFSHDKEMHNAVTCREMKVSLPVQLTVNAPSVLKVGDRYILRAVVSANDERPSVASANEALRDDTTLSGRLSMDAVAIGRYSANVEFRPDKPAVVEFPLDLKKEGDYKVTLVFKEKSGRFSDAVAFSLKVVPASQTITEAHSAVCLPGIDSKSMLARLRKAFTGTSSYGAEYREMSLYDMVRQMLSQRRDSVIVTAGRNSIDVSEQISVSMMCGRYGNTVVAPAQYEKLMTSFQNRDGGFAWFEGMRSSAAVTATILHRNAAVASRFRPFLSERQQADAIAFLDRNWFSALGLGQYLYVRSCYPSVEMNGSVASDKDIAKALASADEYLFPSGNRGLQGRIPDKTLRLATLNNLVVPGASRLREGAAGLLKAWGLSLPSFKKVKESIDADVASLSEYAVKHPSGGCYYPNLVIPWRGLLSSEAYCHSLLCDVLQQYWPEISNGIRLWLMVQKETQLWDHNFDFVNAVLSVIDGGSFLKDTRIAVLSKTYLKPFADIKAAGNGFRVSREYRLTDAGGTKKVLKDGDILQIGDRVEAVYKLWSEENRSFVRLTAPRPACLRPVEQLSSFTLLGYREVLPDVSRWNMELCPEEDIVLTEEFFVTQKGIFSSGVMEIECLYAPEYRANSGFDGKKQVK